MTTLALSELEQVRLILRGGSVVDWFRLRFDALDDVRAFLTLQGADIDAMLHGAEGDRARLVEGFHIGFLAIAALALAGALHARRLPDVRL